MNAHVHNINYLNYAYETLPDEVYENNIFNNIEIMYKRQIKLGDKIVCLYTKEENNKVRRWKNSSRNSRVILNKNASNNGSVNFIY